MISNAPISNAPIFDAPTASISFVPDPKSGSQEEGFTLLEILVAFAILSIALLSLVGMRTDGLMKSAEARNLRIASSLAQEVLAEIRAGQRDAWEMRSIDHPFDKYPDFSFRVYIGEAEIGGRESSLAEQQADAEDGSDADRKRKDRLDWLQYRRDSKRATKTGTDIDELDNDEEKTEEVDSPDEETFEELGIEIRYPSPLNPDNFSFFMLRSRVTTLALSGLTPEQASEDGSDNSGPTPIPGAGAASTGGSSTGKD